MSFTKTPADVAAVDLFWMARAIDLARAAQAQGEVPVGAVLVVGDHVLGEGYNQPIGACDPTAHAEIVALRAAASLAANYRLPGSTLYVTLEPCAMCAGAAGSVFHVLGEARLNHRPAVHEGILAGRCGELLRNFFQDRRTP